MEIELIDINEKENFSDFKSDNPSINTFLRDYQAYYSHIMHLTNTKLIKFAGNVIGFFTMEFRTVEIPIEYDTNKYPVICLKYLAVDEKYEGQGIGTYILEYITPVCEDISKFVGCRCLFIDAIKNKVEWYTDRGFELINELDLDDDNPTVPMFIDFRDNHIVEDYFDE